MAAKFILTKNCFIARQNRLALFSSLGRKTMETHLWVYTKLNNYLIKQQYPYIAGGIGLITWIKAHPLLAAGLAYGAYRAWPYLGDNWLSRNLARAARAGAVVGTAASDVAETISQQPENFQQLGRAGVELGQTVGEIGLNLVQGTVETAQEMGQGAVNATLLGTESALLGLDSVATQAADALVEKPEIVAYPSPQGTGVVLNSVPENAARVVSRNAIKAGVILGIICGTGFGMYELLFHNVGN